MLRLSLSKYDSEQTVGAMVGYAVGSKLKVGDSVFVGETGARVGLKVGDLLGIGVGSTVGTLVGFAVGALVGTPVGFLVHAVSSLR